MAAIDHRDPPPPTTTTTTSDFCYGQSWDVGVSSLIVWAVGAAPSKDTLWTTDNGRFAVPGCNWSPDHEQPAAALHVVLALLSTGPVGISDRLGGTNATLLRRAVARDGTLLAPSKAATTVDAALLQFAGGPSTVPGHVYGTYSGPGAYAGEVAATAADGNGVVVWAHTVVSFKMTAPYPVAAADLWPPLRAGTGAGPVFVRRFDDGERGCADGADAVASGCVAVVADPTAAGGAPLFVAPASDASNVTGP